ncbi:enolase C-terminal domain-like protein [Haloarcula marina]|uniref:enolase C-terminal domain-like protein n=1 Tax=Haloarcula marina TaxID=2961574 RepID=UPI0020B7A1B7|nr:enolase C-terminal domain-like protein [Halomicroarcula marina]
MSRYPRYADRRPSWQHDWDGIGCLVEVADGTVGLGLTRHGPPVAPIIDDHLGPKIVGESALATEKVYDMASRMCSEFTKSGIASYAVSAIDLAMWDLKGKLLERPVYELAGGPAHDELTCYATGNDTDWYMELGFEAMKLACPYGPSDGREGLAKNEELVANCRELVGDDVDIMLDCWMAFNTDYAVRLADRLEPYDLTWIEECLPPRDLAGYAKLRERLPRQTLTTGEHWYETETFLQAVSDGLVDVLQPDIQWAGGMTAMKRIAALADAAGVKLIPHGGGTTPYGQHASYALPDIPWTEYFIPSPPGIPLEDHPFVPGMAFPEDGALTPSDDPGFGIDMSQIDIGPYSS